MLIFVLVSVLYYFYKCLVLIFVEPEEVKTKRFKGLEFEPFKNQEGENTFKNFV